jgi:GNAT superfamily N-acetyltransferase
VVVLGFLGPQLADPLYDAAARSICSAHAADHGLVLIEANGRPAADEASAPSPTQEDHGGHYGLRMDRGHPNRVRVSMRPVDSPRMAFEAHPVTKERWPDLVELFDRPIVRTCFCMFYRKTGSDTGVGLENRKAMKALVDRGTVPGLIGYEDGVPVAWVSLGPREDYAKLRRSPVMKPVDGRPVWSIVCFFVDRSSRGRGLSNRMLRAAVDYARSRGALLLEGYPVDRDERGHPDDMFFGARSMFDRAGFREVARRRPTRPVVRKALRPGRSTRRS